MREIFALSGEIRDVTLCLCICVFFLQMFALPDVIKYWLIAGIIYSEGPPSIQQTRLHTETHSQKHISPSNVLKCLKYLMFNV